MADDADRRWVAEHAAEVLEAARAEALDQARKQLTAELTEALLAAARRGDAAPAAPPPPPVSGDGYWLYGVVDGSVAAAPSLVGVDARHRVELVRAAGLAALVSVVPLDEFGAEALQRGLEDMTVLETLARGHERVLDAALALGPVVPFRLCTIYETADHVREMLDAQSAELAATLQRLSGMQEWGVKGFVMPAAAPSRVAATVSDSGTDYLTRKREARNAAENAQHAVDAVVAAIHEELSEHAAGAVLGRPHDRRIAGHEGDMVLNASYLLAEPLVEDFHALVESLAHRHRGDGIELEITGPWPAYHFVEAA